MTMTKHDQQPPLLTVREVAEILRVSPSLVYQLVGASKLACHRIGRRHGAIRISAADVDVYLAQCRNERHEHMPKLPHPRLKHLKL
jgi:excisionase family DNA binding protein